jgi:c(7)-type cytochrome triheme protein
MKKVVLVGIIALTLVFAGLAMAVPPGKTLTFEDGPMGPVTFSGQVHADAGLKCNDCHTKIFPMKKGGVEINAPHKAGVACFACHDGSKAFSFEGNCTKCHKK